MFIVALCRLSVKSDFGEWSTEGGELNRSG